MGTESLKAGSVEAYKKLVEAENNRNREAAIARRQRDLIAQAVNKVEVAVKNVKGIGAAR